MKTRVLVAAWMAALPSVVFGGEKAVDQLGQAAGQDVSAQRAEMATFRSTRVGMPLPTLPNPNSYQPKDLFAGCSEIDANFITTVKIDDAVGAVNACLAKNLHLLTLTRTWNIEASGGLVWTKGTHDPTPFIRITVSGVLPLGNTLMIDLQHSLGLRNGYLMTFPAQLENKTTLPK